MDKEEKMLRAQRKKERDISKFNFLQRHGVYLRASHLNAITSFRIHNSSPSCCQCFFFKLRPADKKATALVNTQCRYTFDSLASLLLAKVRERKGGDNKN